MVRKMQFLVVKFSVLKSVLPGFPQGGSPPGQPEERKQKCGCFPTLLREPLLVTYFGSWTLKQLLKWTIQTSGEAAVISLVLQQIHGSFPRARAAQGAVMKSFPGGELVLLGKGPSQASMVLGIRRQYMKYTQDNGSKLGLSVVLHSQGSKRLK